MKIAADMNLDELAALMSNHGAATAPQVREMRELLVETYNGCETKDVPYSVWAHLGALASNA